MTLLLVAAGAAVGAPLRYLAGHLLDRRTHWGTLLVNVVGSLLLGLCTALGAHGATYALVGTGFCGALTTYSALAVQSVNRGGLAGTAYAVGTVAVCLLAAWVGLQLG
jgi:CrcB protein